VQEAVAVLDKFNSPDYTQNDF